MERWNRTSRLSKEVIGTVGIGLQPFEFKEAFAMTPRLFTTRKVTNQLHRGTSKEGVVMANKGGDGVS
jgi:hypothetical protein